MPAAKQKQLRITPLGLAPEAHLHTANGRVQEGFSILVDDSEVITQLVEDGRIKVIDDDELERYPDFTDEPFIFAEGAPAVLGEGFAAKPEVDASG